MVKVKSVEKHSRDTEGFAVILLLRFGMEHELNHQFSLVLAA
jgi:hypothetical protein